MSIQPSQILTIVISILKVARERLTTCFDGPSANLSRRRSRFVPRRTWLRIREKLLAWPRLAIEPHPPASMVWAGHSLEDGAQLCETEHAPAEARNCSPRFEDLLARRQSLGIPSQLHLTVIASHALLIAGHLDPVWSGERTLMRPTSPFLPTPAGGVLVPDNYVEAQLDSQTDRCPAKSERGTIYRDTKDFLKLCIRDQSSSATTNLPSASS